MTRRLYYTDPTRRTFEATVTNAFEMDGRPAVTLDETAFYPTSGGQLFDTGRLGGADVVDVVDRGEDVAHVLAAPLAVGSRVTGEIDWQRRFDHMQQHTGQHILSAAFDRVCANATTSVHFGAETSTIDLQRDVTAIEVERAVDAANAIIWEDRPVTIRFASGDEAALLGLRKPSSREGTLRIIDVDGFDVSACGGTHVSRTGSVGVIAASGWERFKGGSRVTFVCGNRALALFRVYRDAIAGCVRGLSVLPAELPTAIERLQADGKELRRAAASLQLRLAGYEATRLVGESGTIGSRRVAVRVLEGWDAGGLKSIASAITRTEGTVVVLVASAAPIAVVVARAPDVAIDAAGILRALIGRFGGRGGGKAELAQGGGLVGSPDDIAEAARRLVADSLLSP